MNEKKRNKGWDNIKPPVKGEVRNPEGRRSHVPADIRELRKFTNEDVERNLHKLLHMNTKELTARMMVDDCKNLERLLGVMLHRAIATADVQRAAFVLERAGCRLPPMITPLSINMQISNIQDMSNTDLIDLAREAITVIETNNKQLESLND